MITAAGNISIPNYSNYDALLVILKGDQNVGKTFLIPRPTFGSVMPFYLNQTHLVSTGFSVKTQGYISNGVVNIAYLSLTGWSSLTCTIYGLK